MFSPVAVYDNSPRNKAHDFLLQGGLTQHAEEVLRELTQGSDFIDDQDYTPLHKAILGLSFTSVEDAIQQNPDDVDTADSIGRTPLSWAAARGDERAIAMLLGYGASPNSMDVQVSTPLDYAADRGYAECCRLLLEAGAHPDPKKPSGVKTGSALNCAARNTSDPVTLKTLLDFNADVESCGVDGKTSLIHVARTDNVEFALLLLEYGADINATSITGETPLTTAIIYNSHKVFRLLLQRWVEYGQCPRLRGAHLLQIVAMYADFETMAILSTAEHFNVRYDTAYGDNSKDYSSVIERRFDATPKLVQAFEDLVAVVRTEPSRRRSVASLIEEGLGAQIAPLEAMAGLSFDTSMEKRGTGFVESESESDGDFQDAKEQLVNCA